MFLDNNNITDDRSGIQSIIDGLKTNNTLNSLKLPNLRYKYYKGLGTSTAAEAKVYFKYLRRYVFDMVGPYHSISKAFGDQLEDKQFRKEELSKKQPEKTDGNTYQQ